MNTGRRKKVKRKQNRRRHISRLKDLINIFSFFTNPSCRRNKRVICYDQIVIGKNVYLISFEIALRRWKASSYFKCAPSSPGHYPFL